MKGWKSLAPNIGRCWSDVDDDTSPSWMPKEMEWMILRLFWSIRISNFENHGNSESGGDSGRVWNEVSPAQLKTLKMKCCCLHHIIGDFSYPAAFAGFYRGSKVSTVEVQMCVNDFSERYIYIWMHNQKISSTKKKTYVPIRPQKDTKRSGPVWCTVFTQVWTNCPGTAGATWHALFRWKADVLPNREPPIKAAALAVAVGGWPKINKTGLRLNMNFYIANTQNVCKVESNYSLLYSI